MALFFLNVYDGNTLTHGPEGVELFDLAAAETEAIAAIHEMAEERSDKDANLDRQEIRICDETGDVLATMPFKSVLTGDRQRG